MRLAKHEGEGDNKELIAAVVADMQDPVTPIFEATLVGQGLHDTCRMIAGLSEIVHHGAAAIDENLLRVRAVEIYLGHVQPPSNATVRRDTSVLLMSLLSATDYCRTGRRDHREPSCSRSGINTGGLCCLHAGAQRRLFEKLLARSPPEYSSPGG